MRILDEAPKRRDEVLERKVRFGCAMIGGEIVLGRYKTPFKIITYKWIIFFLRKINFRGLKTDGL